MSVHLILVLFISHARSCTWSPTQCGCSRRTPSVHHRIVGGKAAVPHSWPWIVSVRRYGGHICGGVAINDRFVLSAAHCFKEYHPSAMPSYSFAMGHHKRQQSSFVSKAKRIELHKSYNNNGRLTNDIALIELERTIDFRNDTLGFVCLPLKHVNDGFAYPPLGQATWVIGWGALWFEGPASEELMQVSVPVTNNQGCKNKVTDPLKQLCAGHDGGGKDSCQGDSGGPLFVTHSQDIFELVGIVSFGSGCAGTMRPGIYTRVSAYISWMDDQMKTTASDQSSHFKPFPQALVGSRANDRSVSGAIFFGEFLLLLLLFASFRRRDRK